MTEKKAVKENEELETWMGIERKWKSSKEGNGERGSEGGLQGTSFVAAVSASNAAFVLLPTVFFALPYAAEENCVSLSFHFTPFVVFLLLQYICFHYLLRFIISAYPFIFIFLSLSIVALE